MRKGTLKTGRLARGTKAIWDRLRQTLINSEQTVEANDIDEPLRTADDSKNGERTRGDGPGMVDNRTVSRDDEDI